jgi:zinc/manganese transport system permease protein
MIIANLEGPTWDLVADIQIILHYHFMQNAFLAGTMIALIAGVIGYFMVLRQQSFAGHSLANVGFAGATWAVLVGISPIIGVFIAGIGAALGIHWLTQNRKINDIAVGAVFTASLALGYLFLFMAPTAYGSTVYSILFGNILGINDRDVSLITWTTFLLLGTFLVIWRPLLFASIDPEVAASRGVPVQFLNLLYLFLLAISVAVAIQVVGVLLIFALLVTPAAIARHLSIRPIATIGIASGFALLFVWFGLAIGFFTPYPVSFFITTFAFCTYASVLGGKYLLQRIPISFHTSVNKRGIA